MPDFGLPPPTPETLLQLHTGKGDKKNQFRKSDPRLGNTQRMASVNLGGGGVGGPQKKSGYFARHKFRTNCQSNGSSLLRAN